MKTFKTEFKTGSGLFFTSDTHFNHENIIRFCERPYANANEMNEKLISNWNSVVSPNDTVFHLGDFAWGDAPSWREIRSQLNGHIVLIKGDHDVKNLTPTAAEELFDYVTFQMQIVVEGRTVILNHYPFLTYGGVWRGGDKTVWQLFGHVHSRPGITGMDKERLQYLFPTQYDVGVDNNNYKPISWDEVKAKIEDNK